MKKQQKPTVYLTGKQPKMNLMALFFFMIGALPLYAQFSTGGQASYFLGLRSFNKLVKITLIGVMVAALTELFTFAL
ncbi:hypothetical protein [Gloeothece verrucosa]|uniref:Putative C-type cytochrome biogenesis protein CcdA n=1 Tax=Gloeothece verrucosa (strain PCC 7822) TaxID=497965 RepID=E0U5F9_GLOV7|nr:hypothetical protein [Gloeothece verrucosa]ADN13549.1 putative C-type cytochrome biogenesis protein CcdA [Gloeothece verrucosa PCC 7822]